MQSSAAFDGLPSNQVSKGPARHIKNEQEKHAGWIQNVVNQKRHIIDSLKKTISREETQNKQRAQRMLDDELASIVSKEYNPQNFTLRDRSVDPRYTA